MSVFEHNKLAWNRESANGGEWSVPVSKEVIAAAKKGEWEVAMTPIRNVPKNWFGGLKGKKILCLASGGGQQAPILAAAGANVTSFDISDEQLKKDRLVASRDDLDLECIQGNMTDLAIFEKENFDLVFHATSNVFVPDVKVVWRECFRVLRPLGNLLSGFMNPSFFLFDHDESERTGNLEVKYKLPYSEPESLDDARLEELTRSKRALEFGHSLESQIGGQIQAGFVISGFYEDYWTDELPINGYSPSYICTKATKPLESTGTST